MSALNEVVLPKFYPVKKTSSGGYMVRCPAHEDGEASLSLSEGDNQPVVMHCFAGCENDDILAALNLSWNDLTKPRDQVDDRFQQPRRDGRQYGLGAFAATYQYVDEQGQLLFEVCRSIDKKFRQRRPDPASKGGWNWSLGETRRVLYRLPEVIEAVKNGHIIYITEGEKDADNIRKQGFTATCNSGGAGKWRPEYTDFLREAVVIICADKDKPGQAHARMVRDALVEAGAVVEIHESKVGKDVSDHLAAGLGLENMETTWTNDRPAKTELAPDLEEFLAIEDEPYDWLVEGLLERGDRVILTGYEGTGKALDITTPVPTPKGWTTMGELSVGDEVFSSDGTPTRIIATTGIMTDRPCYRVTFSDGAEIVADANHLWLTETVETREVASRFARRGDVTKLRGTNQRAKRKHFPTVVTTAHIASTVRARGGQTANHSVETCHPLAYPAQELPIDPYALGAWLGDGTSRTAGITCHQDDAEIIDRIRAAGESVTKRPEIHQWTISGGDRSYAARSVSFQARLRKLGLLQNKHIPNAYLHASIEQRTALLQGLMDTDGTVGTQVRGATICEFSVCDERLARDVLELLHGLGVKVRIKSGPAKLEGRTVGTRWRLSFQTELPVFHLKRKAARLTSLRTRRAKLRYITAVEPIGSVPVRCIQVDREDGMFVAGRECIPTHNSVLSRQMAICVAAGVHPFKHAIDIPPRRVLIVDCENSAQQNRRKYRELRDIATGYGKKIQPGMWRIIHRTDGIDLTNKNDAEWLLERVTAHQPDLLVIGPFYRLHNANINEEGPARTTVAVLDKVRAAVNCALLIEAHAGHGEQGLKRSVRPTGSSLLMRWPEFGIGIVPCGTTETGGLMSTVEVKHWRGQRDQREWPGWLAWGDPGKWPWKIAVGAPVSKVKKLP